MLIDFQQAMTNIASGHDSRKAYQLRKEKMCNRCKIVKKRCEFDNKQEGTHYISSQCKACKKEKRRLASARDTK